MPSFSHLPVAHPRPDGRAFVDTMLGRAHLARPPLVEYLVGDACANRSSKGSAARG